MRVIGKHILVYLLASMFLVSFTGIRLLIHYCMACETTDVAFLGLNEENADAMHRSHAEEGTCHIPLDDEDGATCCGTHDTHSDHGCGDCCQSEVHYLRAEFEITPEKHEPRIEPVLITLLPRFMDTESIVPETTGKIPPRPVDERPPPRLTGRDFIIYAHHLKIS